MNWSRGQNNLDIVPDFNDFTQVFFINSFGYIITDVS